MKTVHAITLGLALSAATITATTSAAFAASKAHAHMGHVSKSWNDTPDKVGLLTIAIKEAEIALFHANAAAKNLENLKWMQTHARHVLHAVDASQEAKGPGKGYGVLKGAKGSAFHIKVAAKQSDASDDVKTHAVHVAASAQNTVDRALRIVKVAKQILTATSAKSAATLTKRMQGIAVELQNGRDANGDGEVTWHKGEGGLKHATKHMGVMYSLEGIK